MSLAASASRTPPGSTPVDGERDDAAAADAEIAHGDAGDRARAPAARVLRPGSATAAHLVHPEVEQIVGPPRRVRGARRRRTPRIRTGGVGGESGSLGCAVHSAPCRSSAAGSRVAASSGPHVQEAGAPRGRSHLRPVAESASTPSSATSTRDLADRLARVEQHQRADAVRQVRHLADGIDQPAVGRRVHERHQPHPLVEHPGQGVEVDLPARRRRDHLDHRAGRTGPAAGRRWRCWRTRPRRSGLDRPRRAAPRRRSPSTRWWRCPPGRSRLRCAPSSRPSDGLHVGQIVGALGGGDVAADLGLPSQVRDHRLEHRRRGTATTRRCRGTTLSRQPGVSRRRRCSIEHVR